MLSKMLRNFIRARSCVGFNKRFLSSQLVRKQIFKEDSNDVHKFEPGATVHGFTVKDVQQVNEFNVTAISLVHDLTQAEYLHLFRNDNNNCFSINFRTTPMDSTGAPHILEHTVLCGSQLYPIRDPFFKMLNRSLATFMNAMTAPDFTMYPFSTQNLSDFRNLQKVYLDAVFRPNLKETDFMQEGWRLEQSDLKNPASNLIIKGVVYNEMKGALSENDNILQYKLMNLLLPGHTYGVCSGGDPLKIPDLTWEALKKFHQEHYHPSNSRFYSYGNFPLAPTLEYINSEYLSSSAPQDNSHTLVPPQKRWESPKNEHIYGRYDGMTGLPIENQNSIVISLAMTDITNVYESFLLQFITELLTKGPNSPFYKSMIEPNFSSGYTQSTGYETQIKDCCFTIGLQGVKEADFAKVQSIYETTIDEVIQSGFKEDHVESVLHNYELSLKNESANFGLTLLFHISSVWNHGGPMVHQLRINQHVELLKDNMRKNPTYLQDTIKRYFKDNPHKLVLTMSPDKEYEEKLEKAESELLRSKTASLTEDDKSAIYKKCVELEKEQKILQDRNILPTLEIGDINNDVPKLVKEKTRVGPIPATVFSVDSNDLCYFRAVLNTSHLSPEQQMILPLFCHVVDKLGTDQLNFREFDSLAQRKTSGLSLGVHIGDSLYQLHSYEPGISLGSYCFNRNLDVMFDLWSQIFNLSALKDVARFEMLVKLYMSSLTQGIADSGHLYAMLAAQALISGVSYQKDLLSGLQHISYMKRLVKISSYAPILNELTNIAKILFDKNNLRVALNVEAAHRDQALKHLEKFVGTLPENPLTSSTSQLYTTTKVWAPTDSINCHHHVLNVPVNYCSKTILTVPYTHVDYAKLRILSKLLTAHYLHPELREKNGAYGSGMMVSTDGVVTFFSYRDPRNTQTLDVFDDTHKWLAGNLEKITEQDLLEAKLGVFRSVDAPEPPGSKGSKDFYYGLTNDVLQRHRAELMTVNKDGLKDVMEKYLVTAEPAKVGKVILGPKGLNTASRKDELWTVVDNE